MKTQTASTYSSTFIDWIKKSLTEKGFLPADLSSDLGSAKLQHIWLNVRNRTISEVANEVKALWIDAVAIEDGIKATAASDKVEGFIARYDNPANWVKVAADGSWLLPADPLFTDNSAAEVAEVKAEVAEVEALTEEEIKSAKKVKKILKADKLNEQIFWYIVQNYPIHSVGFCKTAGIDTRTMQARARAIQAAVKESVKNETVAAHLTRIMGIQPQTAGGWLKAR